MTQKATTGVAFEVRKVSETTAAFCNAIKAIANAEDAVLAALTAMYGEEDANKFFLQVPFEEVQKAVAQYMYINIAETISTQEDKI